MYEDLEKLNSLKEKGAITEEEYQKEKDKILNNSNYSRNTNGQFWGMEEKTFCMLIHISQFAGFIFPFAGFILPIVMWQTEKNNSAVVDKHGKEVVNWIITYSILAIICFILSVVLIGIPLLIALSILNIIFIIKNGIAANEGNFAKYPFNFNFIS